VESIKEAVLDARENAQLNNITNIRFIQGLAEGIIRKNGFASDAVGAMNNTFSQSEFTPPELQPNDIVVLNPPRKGCHVSLLLALLQSQVRTIVYISCNPKTMARDLKTLTAPTVSKIDNARKNLSEDAAKSDHGSSYEIKRIQPVDMFPQTTHVETVVWLERKVENKGL